MAATKFGMCAALVFMEILDRSEEDERFAVSVFKVTVALSKEEEGPASRSVDVHEDLMVHLLQNL